MSRPKLESRYQGLLIKKLERKFPNSLILKNDPTYRQGIPDLVIFLGGRYAFLEVKASKPTCASDYEPNQEWWLDHINKMWYASVIYPENECEVIDALFHALSP